MKIGVEQKREGWTELSWERAGRGCLLGTAEKDIRKHSTRLVSEKKRKDGLDEI